MAAIDSVRNLASEDRPVTLPWPRAGAAAALPRSMMNKNMMTTVLMTTSYPWRAVAAQDWDWPPPDLDDEGDEDLAAG